MAGGLSIPNDRALANVGVSAELAQIASARQALRVLDTAITATELRLRRLPNLVPNPGVGSSGSGMTAEQRLAARHQPRVGRNSRTLMPIRASLGRNGLNLAPALMKYGLGGVSTVMPFHIVSGVGSQILDFGDQMKEVRKAGGSMGEQAAVPVLSAARTAVNFSGASGMAKMLLRAGGFTERDAGARVERTLDKLFTAPSVLKAKERQREAAIAKALEPISKQYKDDLLFLDTWTPDDFDVMGDTSRANLRDEVRKKNRMYVDAIYDLRMGEASHKAAQDARGD